MLSEPDPIDGSFFMKLLQSKVLKSVSPDALSTLFVSTRSFHCGLGNSDCSVIGLFTSDILLTSFLLVPTADLFIYSNDLVRCKKVRKIQLLVSFWETLCCSLHLDLMWILRDRKLSKLRVSECMERTIPSPSWACVICEWPWPLL